MFQVKYCPAVTSLQNKFCYKTLIRMIAPIAFVIFLVFFSTFLLYYLYA